MKGITYYILILSALVIINDLMMVRAIDEMRQDIVELKKEFSYDPKDAK